MSNNEVGWGEGGELLKEDLGLKGLNSTMFFFFIILSLDAINVFACLLLRQTRRQTE